MKNTLWITLLGAYAMCAPIVSAVSEEEEEFSAPPVQQARPKHPARVVESEMKKDALAVPADLQALVTRVQALDTEAFDELLKSAADKSDWPMSVVLRCLTIAAGAGHAPSQVELFKRSVGQEPSIASFWLIEVSHSDDADALKDCADWMLANLNRGAQNQALRLANRAEKLKNGETLELEKSLLSIESEYRDGTYPSLAPGSQLAFTLERATQIRKSAPQSSAQSPAPEPPVSRPALESIITPDYLYGYIQSRADGNYGALSAYFADSVEYKYSNFSVVSRNRVMEDIQEGWNRWRGRSYRLISAGRAGNRVEVVYSFNLRENNTNKSASGYTKEIWHVNENGRINYWNEQISKRSAPSLSAGFEPL